MESPVPLQSLPGMVQERGYDYGPAASGMERAKDLDRMPDMKPMELVRRRASVRQMRALVKDRDHKRDIETTVLVRLHANVAGSEQVVPERLLCMSLADDGRVERESELCKTFDDGGEVLERRLCTNCDVVVAVRARLLDMSSDAVLEAQATELESSGTVAQVVLATLHENDVGSGSEVLESAPDCWSHVSMVELEKLRDVLLDALWEAVAILRGDWTVPSKQVQVTVIHGSRLTTSS